MASVLKISYSIPGTGKEKEGIFWISIPLGTVNFEAGIDDGVETDVASIVVFMPSNSEIILRGIPSHSQYFSVPSSSW